MKKQNLVYSLKSNDEFLIGAYIGIGQGTGHNIMIKVIESRFAAMARTKKCMISLN